MRRHTTSFVLAATLCLAGCDVPTQAPPIERPNEVVNSVDDPDVTVVLSSPADAELLVGIKRVGGDLEIRSTVALELPDLEEVGGSIRILGTATAKVTPNISFPALTRVGGTLSATYGKGSGSLIAPKLAVIGTHLSVSHGSWSLQFGALEKLGGDLRITDAELSAVDFTKLKTIGGSLRLIRFSAAGSSSMQLEFPALETIDSELQLSYGPTVSLALPLLFAVGSDVRIAYLDVALGAALLGDIGGDLRIENAVVELLDTPSLRVVQGDMIFDGAHGPGLETVEYAVLTTVKGGIRVNEVSSMQSLIFDSLTDLGGKFVLNGLPDMTLMSMNVLIKFKSDLLVRQAGNIVVELNHATTVEGDVRIEDCGSSQLRAPRLATINGSLIMRGGTIGAHPALQSLSSVGHDVIFEYMTCLENVITMDALKSIGGNFTVQSMLFLERLVLSSIVTVGSTQEGVASGGLTFNSNWQLYIVTVPSLSRIQSDVVIRDNFKLDTLGISAFLTGVQVGGSTLICGNLGDPVCAP